MATAARPAPRCAEQPSAVARAGAVADSPSPARPHVAVPPQTDALSQAGRSRWRSPAVAFFFCIVGALAFAYRLPSSAYLAPQSGLGYAFGIAGGCMLVLLLVYPMRKRLPRATWLGSTRFWFRTHMTLGVLGPAAILVHSNFSLGATNSNVALACMLVVAGSGLFGRYVYGRIHLELHGRQATLEELKAFSGGMRRMTSAVSYLPELARSIDAEEDLVAQRTQRLALLLQPIVSLAWAVRARRRLRRSVRQAIARGAERRRDRSRDPLRTIAYRYIDDRIGATRRVLEFRAFQKMFSLWHALHMPLFVMLLVSGVVHVLAVHLY